MQYVKLLKKDLDAIEDHIIKLSMCNNYRIGDDCGPCPYYDPEDELCRFDK